MSWKPIFFDPTSRRKLYMYWLASVLAVASTVMAVTFAYGVLILPQLPHLAKFNVRQLSALTVANPPVLPQVQLLSNKVVGSAKHFRHKVITTRVRLRDGKKILVRTLVQTPVQLAQHTGTVMEYPFLMPIPTSGERAAAIAATGQNDQPLTIGFYAGGDEESFASLEKAMPKLD